MKKILLVEDEPVAKALYQNRLQSEGFDVSVAGDGDGALSELSKAQADLVVLDLTLPKMKGAEAVKQIRANDRLKSAPVLVISNAYMTEMSQKAMESGATRGLLKTECTPARLVETVRDLLGYRSAFDVSNSPVNDDKSIAEFANAAEKALEDEIKLKETREEFIKKAPVDIARIRDNCRAYVKATATTVKPGAPPATSEPLGLLYQQVRFFATRAGLSGCVPIALVANAFEALLFDVLFKPARATPSISQTFAQAVDCLERLCQAKDGGVREVVPRAKILVVDDDPVCNLAMVSALKRAHFEPVATEDPTKVLPMAKSSQYDIVMLDINMPGVNGFELCKGLRSMPQYRETPVIFITANADFQNRAQSILSGGNDLIPKPVSPLELVLKVTMRLLQPQGAPASKDAATNGARPSVTVPVEAPPEAPVPVEAKLEPKEATQQPAQQPNPPISAKQASSFSTEMIKKAWSGHTPGAKEKSASADAVNGPEITPRSEAKIELPKIETAGKPNTESPAGEPIKFDPLSIGPLKMAEDDMPKHVNGVDKSEELKEAKIEAAKAETAKAEAAKAEAAKAEAAKAEAAKAEAARAEAAKAEAAKAEAAKAEAAKAEAARAEAARAEAAKAEAAKAEAAKAEAARAEAAKVAAAKAEAAKAEAAKAEAARVAAAKAEAAKTEVPKVEIPDFEISKAQILKVGNPVPVQAHEAKSQSTPAHQPEPKSAPIAQKAETKAKTEKSSHTTDHKPKHTKHNMDTNKIPTLDDAARGVARIIFGDENISDMNVRLTRIALEKYNVPGTQKLDDVARGVSQIIFGDDKVSEMNVRLTRIALERYNVADVLHLNGSNGTKVAA